MVEPCLDCFELVCHTERHAAWWPDECRLKKWSSRNAHQMPFLGTWGQDAVTQEGWAFGWRDHQPESLHSPSRPCSISSHSSPFPGTMMTQHPVLGCLLLSVLSHQFCSLKNCCFMPRGTECQKHKASFYKDLWLCQALFVQHSNNVMVPGMHAAASPQTSDFSLQGQLCSRAPYNCCVEFCWIIALGTHPGHHFVDLLMTSFVWWVWASSQCLIALKTVCVGLVLKRFSIQTEWKWKLKKFCAVREAGHC